MSELSLEDAAIDAGAEKCESCGFYKESYNLIDGEIVCSDCWEG